MTASRATTHHGHAIGLAIGNRRPDPTGLPGISRGPGVLLEYGDLESQFGIQEHPLAVFERQRGSSRVMTSFTHETDAERYLLVRGCPQIVTEPWDGGDRYLWPDGARAVLDRPGLSVSWRGDDALHVMETSTFGEFDTLCRAVWVRDISISELLRRAARR
jgi:hypothetical protein